MLPFPKRGRQPSSVDLEDKDLVTVAHLDDSEDLADTGVLPPKPAPARVLPPVAAPPAVSASPLPRFGLPEDARDHTPGGVPVALVDGARRPPVLSAPEPAWMRGRPSLPWAAVLVAVGAIASAASAKLLEALDPHAPPVAAAAPPATVSLPLTPPAPPKAGPVVLTFAPSDALTVAVPAPSPVVAVAPPPSPAPAPPPVAVAPPPPAPRPAPSPPPAVAAARKPAIVASSSPAPSDSVRHAATIDSLADAQLKAVLK